MIKKSDNYLEKHRLGLSLYYGIVHKHDGEIEANSEVGVLSGQVRFSLGPGSLLKMLSLRGREYVSTSCFLLA